MLDLHDKIRRLIDSEKYYIDQTGMSDANVILFQDKVLKIQTIDEESENECNVMKWLQDKIPVPEVLGFEKQSNKNFLLMTRMPGKMSCDEVYMQNPELLIRMLAEALQMLWEVDISACPYKWNLERKLQIARHTVENNLINMDDMEPETFGERGFKDPKHLIEWLITNKPEEDLVLSHGDFCLPNIFLEDDKVTGFIDLGKTGISDIWQDIALCYRSLTHNFTGKYSEKYRVDYPVDMLFDRLGIEPNWEKIRYYILLDELF